MLLYRRSSAVASSSINAGCISKMLLTFWKRRSTSGASLYDRMTSFGVSSDRRLYATGLVSIVLFNHFDNQQITPERTTNPSSNELFLRTNSNQRASTTHRARHSLRRRIELFHRGCREPQRQRCVEVPEFELHELELLSSSESGIAQQGIECFRSGDRPVVLGRASGSESWREERVVPL